MKEEYGLWVLENRVLTKTFGLKRDERKGEWRRLHTEDLHDLYLPNIIWVIKIKNEMCRGLWNGYGREGVHTGFSLREGDHLKHSGVDGKVILKYVFKKWDRAWIGLIWLRKGDRWRAPVNAVMNLRFP